MHLSTRSAQPPAGSHGGASGAGRGCDRAPRRRRLPAGDGPEGADRRPRAVRADRQDRARWRPARRGYRGRNSTSDTSSGAWARCCCARRARPQAGQRRGRPAPPCDRARDRACVHRELVAGCGRRSELRARSCAARCRAAAGLVADRPFLDWTDMEPFVGHVPSARLRFSHRKLANLHPAEIADLVEAASHEEGEELIEAVGQDRELEADVFEELDEHHQLEFIRERPDAQVAAVLARMAPDDAVDLIGRSTRSAARGSSRCCRRRSGGGSRRCSATTPRPPGADEPRLHRAGAGRLGRGRARRGARERRSRPGCSRRSTCSTTRARCAGSVAIVALLRADRAARAGGGRRARARVGADRCRPAGGGADDDRLQPRDASGRRRGAARRGCRSPWTTCSSRRCPPAGAGASGWCSD